MLKTAIYVDAENIKMCGGYGMRYDVLVGLANNTNSVMLRANCYLAEDHERTQRDPDYRQKVYSYHNILRQCGFKIIKKYVRRFKDEDGNITTKANADMDLAIDALLQARNLDRIILLTGDGDFLRLIIALQNMGCRVEVIGFHNVSKELREVADSYISGFLVPGLLPIVGSSTATTAISGNAGRWPISIRTGALAFSVTIGCRTMCSNRKRSFSTSPNQPWPPIISFRNPIGSLNFGWWRIQPTTTAPRPGTSGSSRKGDRHANQQTTCCLPVISVPPRRRWPSMTLQLTGLTAAATDLPECRLSRL